MVAVLEWAGDEDAPPALPTDRSTRAAGRAQAAAPAASGEAPAQAERTVRPAAPGELPAAVRAALWRGSELGLAVQRTLGSGFAALDAELPGGGWPCHALTEVLQVQAAVAEWRLLAPAMRAVVAQRRDVVVVGPPRTPHLPGLRHAGIDERHLVWIQADAPAQRLWVTEQLVKANAAGLLVAWLPQARQEQIRRLQVCAQGSDGPVFLCRPAAAQHEPSAAPLRLLLQVGLDWELQLRLLKRKGPTHEGVITLESIPGGLDAILTPRLRRPSALIAARRERERRQSQPHQTKSSFTAEAQRTQSTQRNGLNFSAISASSATLR